MPSIFKYNQRKRRSSTNGDSDSPPDTPSPVYLFIFFNDKISIDYEQTKDRCQVVGNTSFISRRLSPPCKTDQVLHPLSEAAKKGDLSQLKELLLQYPNDINYVDSNGYIPLFYGIKSKNAGIHSLFILNFRGCRVSTRAQGQLPPSCSSRCHCFSLLHQLQHRRLFHSPLSLCKERHIASYLSHTAICSRHQ